MLLVSQCCIMLVKTSHTQIWPCVLYSCCCVLLGHKAQKTFPECGQQTTNPVLNQSPIWIGLMNQRDVCTEFIIKSNSNYQSRSRFLFSMNLNVCVFLSYDHLLISLQDLISGGGVTNVCSTRVNTAKSNILFFPSKVTSASRQVSGQQ